MKTVFFMALIIVVVFVTGFVTGMLVYRNNQKKAEALKDKAVAGVESVKDKAEDVAEVLKK